MSRGDVNTVKEPVSPRKYFYPAHNTRWPEPSIFTTIIPYDVYSKLIMLLKSRFIAQDEMVSEKQVLTDGIYLEIFVLWSDQPRQTPFSCRY